MSSRAIRFLFRVHIRMQVQFLCNLEGHLIVVYVMFLDKCAVYILGQENRKRNHTRKRKFSQHIMRISTAIKFKQQLIVW
jgi:hypothetical protein